MAQGATETGQLLGREELREGPAKPHEHPASHKYINISLTSESGGMCRICHEGDGKEKLISPCRCSGTMGLIHRTCLETWLGLAGTTQCELCGYQLTIRSEPRPLIDWFRDSSVPQDRKNMKADVMCFLMLTPLAAISCWLCISGAVHYATDKDHNAWEAVGLVALTIFLLLIYLLWCLIAARYHYRVYQEWRKRNQNIFLELSSVVSNSSSDENNNLNSSNVINLNQIGERNASNTLSQPTVTATLSSRQEDDTSRETGHCNYCSNRRRVLNSTPRMSVLPNQRVHICYCGYIVHESRLPPDQVCEISVVRGVCACNTLSQRCRCASTSSEVQMRGCQRCSETMRNSESSTRNSATFQCSEVSRQSDVFVSRNSLFQCRDPSEGDPWKGEASEKCELVPVGDRQWVIDSQSSSDISPNKSVTFQIPEHERVEPYGSIPWGARSSTPTKSEDFRAVNVRKVKCSLNDTNDENKSGASCTDALLNNSTEDDFV